MAVGVAAAAFAAFRPEVLLLAVVSLILLVGFYLILLRVAMLLRRRPMLCAIAWIAIRVAAIVPFVVAAFVIGGDQAFVVAMMGFFPDAPIWPAFSVVAWIREHLQMMFTGIDFEPFRSYWFWGVHYLATAVNGLIYLAWYGGGGYLAARWARRRFGNRVEPADPNAETRSASG